MKIKFLKQFYPKACCGMVLYFIPLIVMAGRLCTRVVLNIWNLIER